MAEVAACIITNESSIPPSYSSIYPNITGNIPRVLWCALCKCLFDSVEMFNLHCNSCDVHGRGILLM